MKEEFDTLAKSIQNLVEEVNSMNYDEEKAEAQYYKYEEKMDELERNNWEELDFSPLQGKMKQLKKELDLYDAEGELDMMYPNRHDEDFDEDEISGQSFFKD